MRSHFSVSQPKALRSRARGHLSELRRATSPEESHSNLSSSTDTGPDKVVYSMLNLSLTLHSFSSIWKTSSIISIHKMGKPFHYPASFRPISLISCVSKLFERIILSRLLFFLESLSTPSRFPSWTVFTRSNSVSFSVHFGWI